MTSIPKSNELMFIKNYYNMLCNRPATIQQYYMEDSQLTISKEQEKPETCTENFGKYTKSKITKTISKVLISHFSHQRIDDLKSIINVIGQFVYTNSTQSRISHQFVVIRVDSVLYVKNEILTFLDEEILYETGSNNKKTVMVDYANKKMPEVIEFMSEFGEIASIENKGNHKLFVSFSDVASLENIKKSVAKVVAQGYEVEFDGFKT